MEWNENNERIIFTLGTDFVEKLKSVYGKDLEISKSFQVQDPEYFFKALKQIISGTKKASMIGLAKKDLFHL